jgi:hypothetical protein
LPDLKLALSEVFAGKGLKPEDPEEKQKSIRTNSRKGRRLFDRRPGTFRRRHQPGKNRQLLIHMENDNHSQLE